MDNMRGRSKRQYRPLRDACFATWNVEGAGKDRAKISDIMHHMEQRELSIICIQETGATVSDTFEEE
eukprot:9501723-Pyramimonas_sp.AAC.1